MKNILWISRHNMTEEQSADLERIIGEPYAITCYKDTVNSIDELEDYIRKADFVAAVLPTKMLAELFAAAENRPVLQSVDERIQTGKKLVRLDGRVEQEFAFKHRCWQQIIKLEYEVQAL